MAGALALARRGLGNVWPNPAVGCVLVKDGCVVGRGWTQPSGRPHAETEALRRAGAAARGATAYVTLEPCSHQCHTSPCANALIEAGAARVVVAIPDPDPRVAGKGIARMQEAGIAVETGLMAEIARDLNRGYLNRVEAGRPMVTLKLAASLDGKIAAHNGDSRWITGEESRAVAHGLRASHDAVAIGIGTAAIDNPELTCRLPGMPVRPPVRIVFDARLQLSLSAKLVTGARDVPTWIVTLSDTVESQGRERASALRDLGVTLLPVAAAGPWRFSIAGSLQALGAQGLTRLLVEGGSKLAAAFLAEGLVDGLVMFRSPKIIGGDGIPSVAGLGLERVADAARFRVIDRREAGGDIVETFVAIG